MNTTQQVVLISKLCPTEALRKISSVTVTHLRSLKKGQSFVGTITNDSFRIQLMIHFSQGDRIRPEISGEVIERDGGSEIRLSIKSPGGWKEMGVFILLLNILIICIIAFMPGIPTAVKSKWWILLVFLAATGGIFYSVFRSRAYESVRILKKLLNAN